MAHHRRFAATTGALLALVAGTSLADTQGPISPAGLASARVESALNVFTGSNQEFPAIAVAPDGTFVAAWDSRRQDSKTYGVVARVCDARGVPIGDEVMANSFTPSAQRRPALAVGGDGTVWIAWQSIGQDGDRGGIVLRRFTIQSGNLAPLSDEMVATGAGHQGEPSIAALEDGRAMLVWTDVSGSATTVLGRIFAADGAPMGEPVALRQDLEEHANQAAVVGAGDRFAVAWGRVDSHGKPMGVSARIFDSAGRPLTDEIGVSVPNGPQQIEPSIDMNARGEVVIAWMARGETAYEVLASTFAADGTRDGGVLTVARPSNDWLSGAAVAMASDGRFVVTYNREALIENRGEGERPEVPSVIFAQEFSRAGRPLGSVRRIGSQGMGRQSLPIATTARVAIWGDRELPAFAWQGNNGADRSGVALTALGGSGTSPVQRQFAAAAPDPSGSALIPPERNLDFKPVPRGLATRPAGPDSGFEGIVDTGWTPPDPDLSVGPNTVVAVVNVWVSIFNKAGAQLFGQDLVPFFSSVGASGFVFDPVAFYDRHAQRHVIAAVEHTGGNDTSWINIAVSKTSDPQNGTDWWKYRVNVTNLTNNGLFIDFPNLGGDEDAYYVCADYFGGNGGNWVHIFPKANMLIGQPITAAAVQTSGGFRSLGAVNHVTADAPGAYFASTSSGSTSQVSIDAITNVLGTPVRTNTSIAVQAYSDPPGAQQQGTTTRVSTVDRRLKNGVYRDGVLWLAHTSGDAGIARTRWYKVQMNGWPTSGQNPVLLEQGTLDIGPGIYTWFSDLGVDADGNLLFAFNRSSVNEFVGIARAVHLAGDPPNTYVGLEQLQTSTSTDTSGRYGDYSGVDEDPAQPGTFWSAHQYRTGIWRTWLAHINFSDLLPKLEFTYPNGLPTLIDPAGETIRVEVAGVDGTIAAPGTGQIFIDSGSGFAPGAITEVSPNVYDAFIPSLDCLTDVAVYFSAETTEGEVGVDPVGGDGNPYTAIVGSSFNVVVDDDFETNTGWTTSVSGASSGQWERGVPVNDGSWAYDPVSDGDGSGQCWLTQNQAGNTDVDGGSVTLTSPSFDLSSGGVTIEYEYYLNMTDPSTDRLLVEMSTNNGSTWTSVVTHQTDNGLAWTHHIIDQAALNGAGIVPSAQTRIRFTANDSDPQSIVEAGVDGFRISALVCDEVGCPADIDGDGDADGDDFFGYLDLFAAGDPDADLDGDGDRDADDFFAYLDLFAQGC